MANATDQAALDWAKAILSGDYSSIPMYNELTDQQYSDPTQNPYIQAMIGNIQDSLKQDWLGSQAALMDQAEAGGRFGSGLYQAQSAQNMGRTQQALSQAESQLYAQSYEPRRFFCIERPAENAAACRSPSSCSRSAGYAAFRLRRARPGASTRRTTSNPASSCWSFTVVP